MSEPKHDSRKDAALFFEHVGQLLFGIIKELYLGIRYNLIPWNLCFIGGIFACMAYLRGWDRALFNHFWIGKLYPARFGFRLAYWIWLMTSPFWMWALIHWAIKQFHSRKLEKDFCEAGLRSSQGRVPKLIFDKEATDHTHTLRVTVGGATLEKFKKAKDSLESNLGIFIDDMRENRKKRTIDIVYAYEEMPNLFPLKDVPALPACKFLVGETRSSYIKADIRRVPHLLIAGQTGGGKSTFIRQFIVTHLFNCQPAHFLLIDLKEGLESDLFAGAKNVEIYEDVPGAVSRLAQYQDKVSTRLKAIKAAKCLDLDQYLAQGNDPKVLEREFIIIDEAAELFLAGGGTKSSDVQTAKRVLSDVARRGRAAGVHLVISTQRPDTRSLDSQVKANLTGVLCFQMVNDASSITVLGTGKATEISPNPGRAIWKVGAQTIEVQTPLMTKDTTIDLLKTLTGQKSTTV